MIPSMLVAVSAAILGLMGVTHLVLTFRGPKLLPRNPAVRAAMEGTAMVITGQTTLWRAWIGFNVSHSLGAILFGLVFGFLAVSRPETLFGSVFLEAVGLGLLLAWVVLARLYWFVTPLVGSVAALLCFAAGVMMANLG